MPNCVRTKKRADSTNIYNRTMNIIGVGGSNGSGKDTIGEYLAGEHDWLFVNVSVDLIIPELKERGEPLERKNMAALTAEWNRTIRMGAVVDRALAKYEQDSKAHQFNGLVISSLRHPAEADRIHAVGGQVVWVDADPKVRYDRIHNRGQGDKDKKTFDEFLAEENREMTHAGDEATLNALAVKARADIFIENNSSLKSVQNQVDKALNLS